MIILRLIYIITITISMLPLYAYATGFNEALESAYGKNPSLEAARHSLKSVDENMPSAISGFLPTITVSAERGRRRTSFGATSSDKITDDKQLQLNQPLFRGGKTISEIKQAKNTIMSARAELQNTEQNVLLEAITSYMDVISNQEVWDLTVANIDVLKKHRDVTKERFSLGEVTKTDVAQAEASLAIAMAEEISAQGTLESSRALYKRVIGEEATELELVENPISIHAPLGEIIDMALSESPEIKVAKYNMKAAKNNVSARKALLLPTLDFKAAKTKQEGSLFSSGSDIDSDTYSIKLSVPLYQSGSEYSNIRQAKYNLSRLEYDLIDRKNKVRENIITSYNDFIVVEATIKANESAILASEIALEGTQQEARVGARTTLDILDAEQDLFQARVNLVRSTRDEIVSSYTLLMHIGRLNAKELELNVDIYDPEENYNKRKYQIIGF